MNILKLVEALFLTPLAFLGILFIGAIFLGFIQEYGGEILGFVFLIGWLVLLFTIIYKIL